MQYNLVNTAWGWFGFVASKAGLVATYLPRAKQAVREAIHAAWPHAVESRELLPHFARQVEDYYRGKRVRFDVRLDLSRIPPFHAEVLRACHAVPHGKTASYAELAGAAGNANASRAAGSAMAKNPLPLVVPCHRVLRADGSLGGFSSTEGTSEKRRMLQLEGVVPHSGMATSRRSERARVRVA